MTRLLVQTAGLAAVYLLVLTSIDPGDVAAAALLGLGVALVLRGPREPRPAELNGTPWPSRVAAFVGMLIATGIEVVIGSWRVVVFSLGRSGNPGFVEIPREGRSPGQVALWGILTGEAPDEVPVDVDPERDVLIVHLVDASDPEAVRARHRRSHERWHRHVVS